MDSMRIDISNTPIEYFIENCLIKSRAKQSHYKDKICTGNLKDFEEYRFYSAKLKGLIEAEEIMKSTYKSLFEVIEKDNKDREFYGQE
jgi:hypothetical protein